MSSHSSRESENAREFSSGTFKTGTRETENSVVQTTESWQRFFALSDAVVSHLSHEMSSPLGALLANVTLALEDIEASLQASRDAAPNASAPLAVRALLERARDDLEDALRLTERVVEVGRKLKVSVKANRGAERVDILSLVVGAVQAAKASLSFGVGIHFDPAEAVTDHNAPSVSPWVVQTNSPRLTFALLGILSSAARLLPAYQERSSIHVGVVSRDVDVCLEIKLVDNDEVSAELTAIDASWAESEEVMDARALLASSGGKVDVVTDFGMRPWLRISIPRDDLVGEPA